MIVLQLQNLNELNELKEKVQGEDTEEELLNYSKYYGEDRRERSHDDKMKDLEDEMQVLYSVT